MSRRIVIHNHLPKRRKAKTRDDDWDNEKIRRLYKSWTSGGQKPIEAIGEIADNSGKSEQEIKRIVSSRDAADEPYQVAEGRKAAEEGKPESSNPYPSTGVPYGWWKNGYKSVKKTGDGFFSDRLKGKYEDSVLTKADAILKDHQNGRMGEDTMLAKLKQLGLSRKDIDTLY